MSEESNTKTLSQRHRNLIRRGDVARGKRPTAGSESDAVAGGNEDDVAASLSGAHTEAGTGETPGGTRPESLVDGRFQLLARIGSGRLGDIYEARIAAGLHAGIDRPVALQLIDPSIAADPELIGQLRRGYASLRAGPHRNVVSLDEFGQAGKTAFLVMELLVGASLRFVLDDAGQLQPDEAMPIVQAVGNALSYLHGKRIVHGAVIPSAVFIEEDYSVKLLDIVPMMGAVAVPDDSEAPSPKDDIYGLACLTYELLTGRHPFNYATAAEARRLNLVPEVIKDLPPVQWRALAHGLALDPAHRSSSIASFVQDLGSSESTGRTYRAPPVPAEVSPAADPAYFPIISDRRVSPSPPAGGRWVRRGVTVVVLGGLLAAAWIYRAPIRETVVPQLVGIGIDLFAEPNDRVATLIAETEVVQDGAAPPESPAPESPVAQSPAADSSAQNSGAQDAVEPSATIPQAETTAEAQQNPAVDSPVETLVDSVAASTSDPAPADAVASAPAPNSAAETTPATAADSIADTDTDTDTDTAASAESLSPAPEAVAAPILETRFFAPDVVRVTESGSAALIAVRREGDTAASASLIWWARSDTAMPADDYADLGDQTETFAPGELAITILVPIVDDGIPESMEGFIVNLGRRDPDSGSVILVGMTRVLIEDDDNSRL